MARLNPNRRLLVTTFNTALATAAVTATAAGWVAFGMSDTGSAAVVAQPDQPVSQLAPASQQPAAQQQPFSFGRHRDHRDGFGFGASGQGEQPPTQNSSGTSGQSQPSFGGSQFQQPLTSTRSSR
jgi:hypothetical protein